MNENLKTVVITGASSRFGEGVGEREAAGALVRNERAALEVLDVRDLDGQLTALLEASVADVVGTHDLYAGHLYVFIGRRGDRVKVLFWDRGGFVLYYKRLERGRFRMPVIPAAAREVELDATTLAILLDGIDVRRVVRPVHWTPHRAA